MIINVPPHTCEGAHNTMCACLVVVFCVVWQRAGHGEGTEGASVARPCYSHSRRRCIAIPAWQDKHDDVAVSPTGLGTHIC